MPGEARRGPVRGRRPSGALGRRGRPGSQDSRPGLCIPSRLRRSNGRTQVYTIHGLMLNVPHRHAARFCDGSARRDFLKVGGLGLFGLTLQNVLELQDRAKAAPPKFAGATGFGSAKSVILLFPARRPLAHRYLGPQAGCAVERARRVQADQVQRGRHLAERDDAAS